MQERREDTAVGTVFGSCLGKGPVGFEDSDTEGCHDSVTVAKA